MQVLAESRRVSWLGRRFAQAFDLRASAFGFEPTSLGGFGGSGRSATALRGERLTDDGAEPSTDGFPVPILAPMFLAHQDEGAIVGQPGRETLLQTLTLSIGDRRRAGNVPPQFDLAVRGVDPLPTWPARPDGTYLQLVLRDHDTVGQAEVRHAVQTTPADGR